MARIKSPLGCRVLYACAVVAAVPTHTYVMWRQQDDSAAEAPPLDGLEDLSSVSEYTY